MERVIFAEVLDRRGRVRERVRVEALPFHIGRSYASDLILDDPAVSPEHAVVVEVAEGRYELRDAGSTNGIAVGRERAPRASVVLEGECQVTLGRTRLRFRDAEAPVPDAIEIVRHSAPVHWLLEHWSAALVVPGAYLLALLFLARRASVGEFEPLAAASATASDQLLLAAWTGAWALVNRLLRQRTRFVAHASTVFLFSTGVLLADIVLEWMRFFFAGIEPLQLLEIAVGSLLLLGALVAHLTIMGVARTALRVAAAGLVAAAIAGVDLLDHYSNGYNWTVTLPYWSRLEPAPLSWLDPEPADAWFAGLDALPPALDALAEEAAAEEAAAEDG